MLNPNKQAVKRRGAIAEAASPRMPAASHVDASATAVTQVAAAKPRYDQVSAWRILGVDAPLTGSRIGAAALELARAVVSVNRYLAAKIIQIWGFAQRGAFMTVAGNVGASQKRRACRRPPSVC